MARRRARDFGDPTPESQIAAMRQIVNEGARNQPGVYRMIAADGEIVYVGKSKQIRSRLLSYFRAKYPEEKGARILREAAKIEWDYEPSEFASLLRELHLIKRYRPRLNVAMKRDALRYSFIKLTRGPAPKLLVVRGPGADDASTYYGPFVGAQRIAEAVRELNDLLGLRDCQTSQRMIFADQPDFFLPHGDRTPGCLRYEIGKCLGPCVGGCTVNAYAAQVALARAFLDGTDFSPLRTLEAQMHDAAETLQFERAAALRDKLARLETLRDQFKRLRFAVETLSFVYPVEGVDGANKLYLIRRGVVRAQIDQPRTTAEQQQLTQLVEDIFGEQDTPGTTVPTHEIDELLLLSSWFRKFPAELDRARTNGVPLRKRARRIPLATLQHSA